MKLPIRQQAIKLRKAGWSYAIIAERLAVSKSTLSHWLRDIPYVPNKSMIARIAKGPLKASILRNKRKLATIANIKKEAAADIRKVSERDLFMLGLGLYIGEGTKTYEDIRLINADPYIIKLGIEWFTRICNVPKKNFAISLHIYPDTNEHQAKRYWSQTTNIPLNQFLKTQTDKRIKKSKIKTKKLPYGTAHLSVRKKDAPDLGVLLHRRIMGWIETIYARV